MAITAAGLNDTLSQEGAFTLFAPSNDAFDALDEETLNLLLATPDQLQDLLLYHVVRETEIDSVAAIAAAGSAVPSASGEPLSVSLNGGEININNAAITEADIAATNGIVHAIDTLLNGNPEYSELVSLLTRANLTNTLNDENASFTLFAPNNAAILNAEAAGLIGNTAALTELLLGHITVTPFTGLELVLIDGTDLELVNGAQSISLSRGDLFIGGVEIIDPDVIAQNGIIHGIDAVLTPQ